MHVHIVGADPARNAVILHIEPVRRARFYCQCLIDQNNADAFAVGTSAEIEPRRGGHSAIGQRLLNGNGLNRADIAAADYWARSPNLVSIRTIIRVGSAYRRAARLRLQVGGRLLSRLFKQGIVVERRRTSAIFDQVANVRSQLVT